MEITLIIIKHDAIQRNIFPDIMKRFADKGLQMIRCEFIMPTEKLIREHYKDLTAHPKFEMICGRFLAGPVLVIAYEGMNAVSQVRKMIGKTDPKEADVGTIRGDYGLCVERNTIHGSDSVESAQREFKLWFDNSIEQSSMWFSWNSDLSGWSNWTPEDEAKGIANLKINSNINLNSN